MMSGSIDLLDDTSSDESFDDGKPISKSLTLLLIWRRQWWLGRNSSTCTGPASTPLVICFRRYWCFAFFRMMWDRPTIYRPRHMRRISSSYCSVKDFLHRITEGTNKNAAKVQQRKGIINDITIKQSFFLVFFLVNDKN